MNGGWGNVLMRVNSETRDGFLMPPGDSGPPTKQDKERKYVTKEKLTPNEASQRLKNRLRTVTLICPQAETIWLIAAPITGEVKIRCSADIESPIVPAEGRSSEGKSSPSNDKGGDRSCEGVCGREGELP